MKRKFNKTRFIKSFYGILLAGSIVIAGFLFVDKNHAVDDLEKEIRTLEEKLEAAEAYTRTFTDDYALATTAVDAMQDENDALLDQNTSLQNEVGAASSEKLPMSVMLDVEAFAQTHHASCESAAAHAAMKYWGVDMGENDIIAAIGADTETERYFDDQGRLHWGNPQKAFVGDIDGEDVYVDGYGVYNQPVYKVLAANGFSKSISKTGWNFDELMNHVKRGYPVIAWTSYNYKDMENYELISPDGAVNTFIYQEHAVVVRGYDGENVYIMDVYKGVFKTISKSDFIRGMANLDNMAIVVVPD
jgi:uncharacterized protein YvpB